MTDDLTDFLLMFGAVAVPLVAFVLAGKQATYLAAASRGRVR